jgi:hypothetical protein
MNKCVYSALLFISNALGKYVISCQLKISWHFYLYPFLWAREGINYIASENPSYFRR